jgi:proline iminopeptidase
MYPEIEPYAQGMLDVGDDNWVYWETCGNPHGKPVVVLHGGPGTGCNPGMRRLFDPSAYRIILFDQRGSGRSRPHASDYTTNLAVNTTAHLLADMERLRTFLDVERWMVWGGSWGCTLGIAYAETYPQHVSALLLVGVTTTRRSEINWLYREIAPLFPEQWKRFREGVPEEQREGDLVAAYYHLLQNPDPGIRSKAALNWCDWEASMLSVQPDFKPGARWYQPEFQMAFARLVTHYFHHGAWLEEGILIRNAARLNGIPGRMIHGRLDLDAPLTTAWELSQVWHDGELIIVQGAGHSSTDPGMTEATIAATDHFARS